MATKKKEVIIITLEGRDAEKAVAELLSNVEYDRLNVTVKVERN